MIDKKGQGLSMNVIIIAAIALLILVILTVLILNTGENVSGANACENVPGAYCDTECDTGDTINNFGDCTDPDDVCCQPIGAQEE